MVGIAVGVAVGVAGVLVGVAGTGVLVGVAAIGVGVGPQVDLHSRRSRDMSLQRSSTAFHAALILSISLPVFAAASTSSQYPGTSRVSHAFWLSLRRERSQSALMLLNLASRRGNRLSYRLLTLVIWARRVRHLRSS